LPASQQQLVGRSPLFPEKSMSSKSDAPTAAAPRAQPESLRARALSLSLTVKDLQKSLKWYRDVVGFHQDRTWERDGKLAGAAMLAGDVRINLNQDDGKKGWDRVKGQGVSMHLTTTQDIDEIAAGIKQRGGKLDDEPSDKPWGVRSFGLTDPDGYLFSIQVPLQG
jgi:uncharacterized glyoxalase superfamily protein PhnB